MSNKVEIKIVFEAERLEALEVFLGEENTSVSKKLEEALQQLYEETVPEPVRKFMDAKVGAKPRRAATAAKPRNASKAQGTPKPMTRKESTEDGQPRNLPVDG